MRHAGPMAQDFYAAFGVGEDDRHIASVDEDGVVLAAVKGLQAQAAAMQRANDRLARELAPLRESNARLQRRIDAVAAKVARSRAGDGLGTGDR